MTSSYTTNKSIEKPANGDYVNTWSTPVNNDWDIIDKAFGGKTTLNVVSVSGTVALTASQYQPPIIIMSGALTANINYQIPAGVGGFWFIYNNTSGSFSITFSSGGGGTSVTLVQGKTTAVISDGTNIGLADTNLSPAAGSNTQVQYNNGGLLGASSNFVFDTNKVGIGISSPKTTLQVTGSTYLNAPVLTSATGAPFYFTNADSAYGLVAGVNSADGHAWFQAQRTDGTSAAANITFAEAGGNVGVGTTTPTFKLVAANNSFDGAWMGSSGTYSLVGLGGYFSSSAGSAQIGYERTTGAFVFGNGTRDVPTEMMRITPAGLVGIGTTTPARKLDVAGGGRFLQDTAATTGAVVLRQNSGDTVGGFIQWVNNNNSSEKGWMVVDTSSNMIFAPNSAEAVRFTSAGRVGIGTSSPAQKLHVASGSAFIDGNTYVSTGAGYWLTGSGSFATGIATAAAGGALTLYTSATERIRVTSTGNVGIGTTSPSVPLEVAGDVRIASGGDLKISAAASGNDMAMYNDNGDMYWNNGAALMYLSAAGALTTAAGITAGGTVAVTGNITATGDITATGNVTAYSDVRLKTDLQRIDSALDKVEKLAGYTFTRTDTGDRQTGLLAQDVQSVLPEAVVEGEYLSVAYGNLMGLMVEAIKELRADLAELKRVAVKVNKP